MNLKKLLNLLFVLALVFAGFMSFLYFREGPRSTDALPSQSARVPSAVVSGRGKTVSGKPGKLIIAYAGDIVGSLDPCG
jgi:hypothetical protein